jgi:phosphoribosylformimino-5-aminoimidazole carboxamide ribotide isomerase
MSALRILPVLDVMEGRVVRGIAGRREDYRPIQSVLAEGSDPLSIAEAIRSHFGLTALYLADLDAIRGGAVNLGVLRSLIDAGFALAVDAGLKQASDAQAAFRAGVQQVVAGLETLDGPDELLRLVREWGASRVVFSLDLRDGKPLGNRARWKHAESFRIASQAVEAGCTELIVLDIARVGTGAGVSTLPLCAEIRRALPQVRIVSGGGVSGLEDLRRLDASIVDGVLIASALHNGSIGPKDLAEFLS